MTPVFDPFEPAHVMRDRIANQEIKATELVEIMIERIEKVNPVINAYCTPTFDLARKMAAEADARVDGGEPLPPLNGVPCSIKDLQRVKGVRTTFGSKLYENYVPDRDDVVVERLRNAGIVILGKTNTPEFGFAGVTHNKIFGITRNPWNLDRNPGGSSGGAAAACATGTSPVAQGSDGGGSLRHPACFCGVFGMKPQFGRVPNYPTEGVRGQSITQVGPISRFVKDAALVLDVLKGPHDGDRFTIPDDGISYFERVDDIPKKLKVGYSLDLGYAKVLHPDVEKNTLAAIDKLCAHGWDIEEVNLKKSPYKIRNPETGYYIWYTSIYGYDFGRKLKKYRDLLDPNVVRLAEAGLSNSGMDVFKAIEERKKLYLVFYRYFKDYDLLITPTTAIPAFEQGIMYPPRVLDRSGEEKAISPTGWMPFTFPFNYTGHPAASVPSGFSREGLPTGLQFVGPRFGDLLVLQAARAFEIVAPWQDKRPPL